MYLSSLSGSISSESLPRRGTGGKWGGLHTSASARLPTPMSSPAKDGVTMARRDGGLSGQEGAAAGGSPDP